MVLHGERLPDTEDGPGLVLQLRGHRRSVTAGTACLRKRGSRPSGGGARQGSRPRGRDMAAAPEADSSPALPHSGTSDGAHLTNASLQTFLQGARSDRFFAPWVLEATSGMRRCELAGIRRDLLDLAAGTLEIDVTRVVVDGRVIESDGKTENAQHVLALDPFTLAVLKAHVEMLDRSARISGRTTTITACCSAGRTAGLQIPTRSRDASSSSPQRPVSPRLICTTSATATPPQAGTQRSIGRR